jgi:hypothetical protein
MMKAGGSKCYFATNHLYSVAALTDSTGAVVERYKYDSFVGPEGMPVGEAEQGSHGVETG